MLHLIHQLANIVGHGVHTQRVEAAVEHMGLDAHLVERLAEGAHRLVGILAGKQVHLLEGTAVGLNAGKASHLDYHWGYAFELSLQRLKLSRTLPHISIYETELDFLFHQ